MIWEGGRLIITNITIVVRVAKRSYVGMDRRVDELLHYVK